MAPFLEVKNITKDFFPPITPNQLLKLNFQQTAGARVLDGISFSLNKGLILCVLGPNGAGKTTLLKIISTLILPDNGSINVNGLILGKDDEKIRANIGLVAEDDKSFYWRLTGRQNLEFFASLYGLEKKQIKTRIMELLGLFEVDYENKRFDTYSTGMKKRFALMRGMLHNPQLLLLDEPEKSLDYTSSLKLKNIIQKEISQTQGKTVIFTTHLLDEALQFADTFLLLYKGKLRAFGTLKELQTKIGKPEAKLDEIYLNLTTLKPTC